MAVFLDIPHLHRFGWMRAAGAVPVRMCERLVVVLEAELGVPVQAPWWRSRPGYDHIEPWPPATLTELGSRLLGLDAWPLQGERC